MWCFHSLWWPCRLSWSSNPSKKSQHTSRINPVTRQTYFMSLPSSQYPLPSSSNSVSFAIAGDYATILRFQTTSVAWSWYGIVDPNSLGRPSKWFIYQRIWDYDFCSWFKDCVVDRSYGCYRHRLPHHRSLGPYVLQYFPPSFLSPNNPTLQRSYSC